MDEQRVREIRERRARIFPDAARVEYPNEFTILVDFDIPWLLDALAAREGEAARLREAICSMANGPVRREPSLGFSPPIGFDEYVAWVDTVARAALAAPPSGDGAGE